MGGIIVIDFVDMEIQKNREDVLRVFREALSETKATQVLGISELGLVEMTQTNGRAYCSHTRKLRVELTPFLTICFKTCRYFAKKVLGW